MTGPGRILPQVGKSKRYPDLSAARTAAGDDEASIAAQMYIGRPMHN